jgi:hypothetical protein
MVFATDIHAARDQIWPAQCRWRSYSWMSLRGLSDDHVKVGLESQLSGE